MTLDEAVSYALEEEQARAGCLFPSLRAPDNVVFYQNTQLPERSAHDPESLFLILQERMEYQCQVPTIPDYALHRLAQSPPETERGKRLFRTSEGLPQTTEARQIVVSVEMPPGER